MTTLVWFRDDLRVADHPALAAACAAERSAGAGVAAGRVVALYVLDEVSPGVRPLGGAAKWWLHHSLDSLAASLARLGIDLVLRRGPAEAVVPAVAAELAAAVPDRAAAADSSPVPAPVRVVWNRRYGGAEREIDTRIKQGLRAAGFGANSFAGGLLHEPWKVATDAGTPYRVFSAFWRQVTRMPAPAEPLPAPTAVGECAVGDPEPIASEALASWGLLPTRPDWAAGLRERWSVGEAAAHEALETFLDDRAHRYDEARDQMALDGTSGLAPHLRWGEISPRQVWHRALRSGMPVGGFLSEIGWREFAWHTLFHHPDLHRVSLDERFDPHAWVWRDAASHSVVVEAWQRGETGFGVVDAGMRELWRTGAMHNRARMVVASLLTKNLGVDWRVGEAWFWDTLVDADAASNPFNWQWVAGCGLDAAPYFRVFNPELQAKRFDASGAYQARWAPHSQALPPIVDLRASRIEALARYQVVKGS